MAASVRSRVALTAASVASAEVPASERTVAPVARVSASGVRTAARDARLAPATMAPGAAALSSAALSDATFAAWLLTSRRVSASLPVGTSDHVTSRREACGAFARAFDPS